MNRYSGFKLLIVDDIENNLYSLNALISKHMNVQVLQAVSGREAIDIALGQPDIDLIMLDVQMPDMDGFQTASMLKVRKKTRDIPIIFLTAAFKTEEFQQKGYALGAADYLLKPIDDAQLINKISTYFRLIEKERSLNQRLEAAVAERTRELAQSNLYLSNIIRNMGEALLILSPEGVITSANPAACRMLRYQEPELLGKPIGDIFEEDNDQVAHAFMGTWLEAVIRVGALEQVEACFIRNDDQRIPILISRSAIRNEDRQVTDIICIAKDMSGYSKHQESDQETP